MALGFGRFISCDTSSIPISAILGPAFRLSSNQKLLALRHNQNRYMPHSERVTCSWLISPCHRYGTNDSTDKASIVQGSADRPNNRGRSSSRPPTNQRSRSKSRDNRICNYCKKLGHIKDDCRALKPKTDKAQRADQKSGRHEEVNYIGSSANILTNDPNILSIENPVESEVLLTTEESSTWLLDSGASYHVTPH